MFYFIESHTLASESVDKNSIEKNTFFVKVKPVSITVALVFYTNSNYRVICLSLLSLSVSARMEATVEQ